MWQNKLFLLLNFFLLCISHKHTDIYSFSLIKYNYNSTVGIFTVEVVISEDKEFHSLIADGKKRDTSTFTDEFHSSVVIQLNAFWWADLWMLEQLVHITKGSVHSHILSHALATIVILLDKVTFIQYHWKHLECLNEIP